MSDFMFRVEEVTRDGFIAWDAVEECSGDRFPLNVDGSYDAGKFPEITDFLLSKYGIKFDVSYCDDGGDSLNNNVWSYHHGADVVVVKDITRTVFRISSLK